MWLSSSNAMRYYKIPLDRVHELCSLVSFPIVIEEVSPIEGATMDTICEKMDIKCIGETQNNFRLSDYQILSSNAIKFRYEAVLSAKTTYKDDESLLKAPVV